MRGAVSIAVLCGVAGVGCLEVPLGVPERDVGSPAGADAGPSADATPRDTGAVADDGGVRDATRDAAREPYFIDVTNSGQFVCALTDDGRVACWGNNFQDAIDIADDARFLPPTWISTEFRFEQIDSGAGFVCGLTVDAGLVCWGANPNRLLADTEDLSIGVEQINTSFTMNDLVKVRLGPKNICVHLVDSTAWCWGPNQYWVVEPGGEQVSLGPTRMSHPDVYPAEAHACGRFDSGSIQCWGNNASFRALPSGSMQLVRPATPDGRPFREVAPGILHTCGLREDGAVTCWGSNGGQRLGEPSADIDGNINDVPLVSNVERIDTDSGTCALHTDGAITCWGPVAGVNERPPTRFEAPDDSAFESVAVGSFAVCATSVTGVWCWGSNGAGSLGRIEGDMPAQLTSEVPMRIDIPPPP